MENTDDFAQKEIQKAKKWLAAHKDDPLVSGKALVNNNRKHLRKENRDMADITLVDRESEAGEYLPTKKALKFSNTNQYLNEIYSKSPEGMHELMSDPIISKAMDRLSDNQKNVLFLHYVQKYTTEEIAERMGCSARNIRDIRQRALEAIRKAINNKRGECTITAAVSILFWPFALGWYIANKILPPKRQAN